MRGEGILPLPIQGLEKVDGRRYLRRKRGGDEGIRRCTNTTKEPTISLKKTDGRKTPVNVGRWWTVCGGCGGRSSDGYGFNRIVVLLLFQLTRLTGAITEEEEEEPYKGLKNPSSSIVVNCFRTYAGLLP
jgi:hypothetical protein